MQRFVEEACNRPNLTNVERLMLAGGERLPPRDVYEAHPRLVQELGPYRVWSMHWKNRPRAVRMVEWRAGLEARTGLGRVQRCCEDGRPLELERSLFGLGAARAMDESARRHWRSVAREAGHSECVDVLDAFGDGATDEEEVTCGRWCCVFV